MKRIEICGPIGAGKTTLANFLIDKGYTIVPENFNLNPFWEAFYTNPGHFIFETEISFMLQHYHELKKIEKKHFYYVCDYSFVQDLAYAKMGLQGKRLQIFKDIYQEILEEYGHASLIICLQCETDRLIERILGRGREEEQNIDANFLENLSSWVNKEIGKLESETNVMYIDTGGNNFITDLTYRRELLEEIDSKLEE